mgnify:CR=1 FL=1
MDIVLGRLINHSNSKNDHFSVFLDEIPGLLGESSIYGCDNAEILCKVLK